MGKAERQKIEAERIEAERIAEKLNLGRVRIEAEKIEAERIEAERIEAENKNGVSLTGEGKTLITVKAGRVKKTDEEFTEAYNTYVSRMEKRNVETPQNTAPLKILDREAWNKSKPSGETSHEIFVRLTKARMKPFLSKFDNISNLAKYEHDEKQTEKIIKDLTDAVEKVKTSFAAKSENKETEEEYQI